MEPEQRLNFYSNTIDQWITDKNSKILVVGAGTNDRNVLFNLGFQDVVISNLDSRIKGDEFFPYKWSFLDAENLDCQDNEYDYVIIHAALHHCSSPHRALLEMYRVSKQSLIFFEARDSLLMRTLVNLNVTSDYETIAVYFNDCLYGGVRNTEIPNFVYRWTEREIEKTIFTYAPYANHQFHYQYGNDVSPMIPAIKNPVKRLVIRLAVPIYKVFAKIYPKQQNLLACKVDKPSIPEDLHEWLNLNEEGQIKFNRAWGDQFYSLIKG
jgi:ubiquinone/menaquinone biosynthesis C-methylase UbiE